MTCVQNEIVKHADFSRYLAIDSQRNGSGLKLYVYCDILWNSTAIFEITVIC